MVVKKKCRKTKGSFSGIRYTESRDVKRQRVMRERVEKAERKAQAQADKRAKDKQRLQEEYEIAELRRKKRVAESKARQAHPIRRILSKSVVTGRKSKKRGISWI